MGWTIEDKITLVVSQNKYDKVNNIKKAYLVNPQSKKSLESAKTWAREYKIYTIDNDGFKLKILSSAGGSSQGGKLSFWNCELIKGGLDCSIGINSDFLCSLLLHCDFSHGECLEPVYLARYNCNVAAITESMPEYKEAKEHMKLKASLSKGKTKKWVQGCNYITPTLNDLYVGKVYTPLQCKYISHNCYDFIIDFDKQKHIYVSNYDRTKDNLFDSLFYNVKVLPYGLHTTHTDCPSRKQGDVVLKINKDFPDLYKEKIIDLCMNTINDYNSVTYLEAVLQSFDGNISENAMKYFDLFIEKEYEDSKKRYNPWKQEKQMVRFNGEAKLFNELYEALKYVKQIFVDKYFSNQD